MVGHETRSQLRDRLLVSIVAGLDEYSRSREPSLILGAHALQETQALRGLIPKYDEDLEAVHAVAWFHWFRYRLLGPQNGTPDFEIAWPALDLLSRSRPETLPSDFMQALGFVADSNRRLANDGTRRHVTSIVNTLAIMHTRRYETLGDIQSLSTAAILLERLAKSESEGPIRAIYLNNLSNVLRGLAASSGDASLLQRSIAAIRESVSLTPPGDRDEASRYDNLGSALATRYVQTGDRRLVITALEAGRRALELTAPDDPSRPARLSNMCARLLDSFHRTGAGAELDEAEQLGRQAVGLADGGGLDHTAALNNLGRALLERFVARRHEADLAEATDLFRHALELSGPLGAHYTAMAVNLRVALGHYAIRGAAAAAAEAVALAEQDLHGTPSGHPAYGDRVNGLAMALRNRFRITGEPGDLETAVELSRRAAELPDASGQARAASLNEIFLSLWEHYLRTNSQQSLWSAIASLNRALSSMPAEHESRSTLLSNLGSAWYEHYLRTRRPRSLVMADRFCREAVVSTRQQGGVSLAGRLSNLSGVCLHAFALTGDTAALDEAVAVARESVRIAAAVGSVDPAMLNSLSRALLRRPSTSSDPEERAEAVATARAALVASADSDPRRATYVANLCLALWQEYQITGHEASLEEIDGLGGKASALLSAAPVWRIRAAHLAAVATAQLGTWPRALAHYANAVELLPHIASRQLSRADQESGLVQTTNVANKAASAALELGEPEEAITLLEKGRALIHAQVMDTRTDLDDLRRSAPHLAERLEGLTALMAWIDWNGPVQELSGQAGS